MRDGIAVFLLVAFGLAACGPRPTPEQRAGAVTAFATIQQVFQHPRCQNCHIPGDAPLQYNAGLPHTMGVERGSEGKGGPGLPCTTCHGSENAPAAYGPHAPPGAPNWHLPPPDHKMAWIGLSPAALCKTIKSKRENGGRSLESLLEHVSHDSLVLWGWRPGGNRDPVPVPHEELVVKFKQWAAAGGPCPEEKVAFKDP